MYNHNLEFDYVVTSTAESNGFGQIIQADYLKLGVKMNIVTYDSATWVDQLNGRKFNGLYFAQTPYCNL
jgi:ABC-type transport system substrate-binding protein